MIENKLIFEEIKIRTNFCCLYNRLRSEFISVINVILETNVVLDEKVSFFSVLETIKGNVEK